jgi:hypothetical protein
MVSVPVIGGVMVSVPVIGGVMVSVPVIGGVMVSVPVIGGVMVSVPVIGGVMVSVPVIGVVDCGLELWSSQTKVYKTDICYISANHAALRSKSKDFLARYQDNVSEWSYMSNRTL